MHQLRALNKVLACSILALMAPAVHAQRDESATELFRRLATATESYEIQDAVLLARAINKLASSDAETVSAAIQPLTARLQSRNHEVRVAALLTLQHWAARPDGLKVIGSVLPTLQILLIDPDGQVAGLSAEAIGLVKPRPPVAARVSLIQVLSIEGVRIEAQTSAILSLVRLGIENDRTANAIITFYRKQSADDVKIAVLNALGTGHLNIGGLAAIFADALASKNGDLQSAAIYAAANAGENALFAVRPSLSNFQGDSAVRSEVRELARKVSGNTP